jgi:Cu(I)/Ag(I) efflux system membrane fusion protein
MADPTAPAGKPLTGWQKVKLVVKVIEVRLRFIAILVATGLVIGYWDTITNYWDKWTRPAAAAVSQVASDQEFYCPMHPQVVRAGLEPNGEVPKCPICGMPLSLRKKGEAAPLPPGVTGRVQLSPERIQLAGIQTAEVGYQALTKTLTTVGDVAYDESRLSRVVSRIGGYVEKIYVDKTYATVKQGDPLVGVYSPELYSAAQELILAGKREGLSDMVASARRRLELLGVAPKEIDEIAASGKASATLVLRSPQSGDVTGKPIVAGARVDAGMTLVEVADISTVWVEAEVYEKDLPFVRVGQKIEATVEAVPNRTFTGKVSLIYPRVETATRTNRVRFEVENPEHALRPGMFATVRLETPLDELEPFKSLAKHPPLHTIGTGSASAQPAPGPGQVLAVPERAVIDTGAKQIVYVEREPGLFEGVEVVLGPRAGAMYPVVKGLQPGDRVAAAGAFLVDAETRLNPAAAATYYGASGGPQTNSNRPSPGPGRPAGGTSPREPTGPNRTTEVQGPGAPPLQPVQLSPEQLANIDKLPPEDRQIALAQRVCPITGLPLGSMGKPHKIFVKGQVVILCCKGCVEKAVNNADKTLEKIAQLKAVHKN